LYNYILAELYFLKKIIIEKSYDGFNIALINGSVVWKSTTLNVIKQNEINVLTEKITVLPVKRGNVNWNY